MFYVSKYLLYDEIVSVTDTRDGVTEIATKDELHNHCIKTGDLVLGYDTNTNTVYRALTDLDCKISQSEMFRALNAAKYFRGAVSSKYILASYLATVEIGSIIWLEDNNNFGKICLKLIKNGVDSWSSPNGDYRNISNVMTAHTIFVTAESAGSCDILCSVPN